MQTVCQIPGRKSSLFQEVINAPNFTQLSAKEKQIFAGVLCTCGFNSAPVTQRVIYTSARIVSASFLILVVSVEIYIFLRFYIFTNTWVQ